MRNFASSLRTWVLGVPLAHLGGQAFTRHDLWAIALTVLAAVIAATCAAGAALTAFQLVMGAVNWICAGRTSLFSCLVAILNTPAWLAGYAVFAPIRSAFALAGALAAAILPPLGQVLAWIGYSAVWVLTNAGLIGQALDAVAATARRVQARLTAIKRACQWPWQRRRRPMQLAIEPAPADVAGPSGAGAQAGPSGAQANQSNIFGRATAPPIPLPAFALQEQAEEQEEEPAPPQAPANPRAALARHVGANMCAQIDLLISMMPAFYASDVEGNGSNNGDIDNADADVDADFEPYNAPPSLSASLVDSEEEEAEEMVNLVTSDED